MEMTLPLTRTGRIGDLVFCRRYGRIYARRYVVPKATRSDGQITRRTAFAEAVRAWRALPAFDKSVYKLRGASCSPPRTGYHLFLAEKLQGSK